MPLCMMNDGDEVSIVKVKGKKEERKHLMDMGFVVGEKIRIVSKNNNIILIVKDTKVGIIKLS